MPAPTRSPSSGEIVVNSSDAIETQTPIHTSVDGREGHDPYAPTRLDVLRSKGHDYWALGHVHEREVLCRNPWVVFPGNLQGRHARETGAKGATLVEVDDVLIGSRRWAFDRDGEVVDEP